MALGTSPKGAWINTSAIQTLEKAAERYSSMPKRTSDAALSAGTAAAGRISDQMRSAGVDEDLAGAVGVYEAAGNLHIGVSDEYADRLSRLEYGDEDNDAQPFFRRETQWHPGQIQDDFYGALDD